MNGFNIRKSIYSIILAGSVLCGNSIPAYAINQQYQDYSSIDITNNIEADVGEYLYKQLSVQEQNIYKSIISQIDELKKDDKNPSGVKVTVPDGYSISGKPIFAVFRDHPEFFWIDSSNLAWAEAGKDTEKNDIYSLVCKDTNKSFFYEGFTTENLQSYIDRLNAKVKEIKEELPSTANDDISKLKYINNWIAKNNVYNASGLGATNFSRCAASGLLSDNDVSTTDDDPVCYGYATAMKVLLDAFGIENAYIEGWAYNTSNRPSGEQHAWNYVHIDNEWYAIDPTWDDPRLSTLPARQNYFLVGQNTITEKGFANYEMFKQNHDSSETKSPAYTTWRFTYPELTQEARNPNASGNVLVIDKDGNTSGYDTLEAAVNNANSGDTLILQNAISLDKTVTINKDITIDLNGQFTLSSSPVAINSSIAPVFNINSNNSVSIINSGSFTAINLNSTSSNIITNNGSLTLGPNVKLSSSMPSLSGSVVSGKEPRFSQNTRHVESNRLLTAYLAAEPKQPQNGQFTATDNDTVQNLLNSYFKPSIIPQYYDETGSLKDIPSDEYTINWQLKQSPNGGNNIDPSDPLENGSYRFEAKVFDYVVPYIVEVSGISEGTQPINSISISGLNKPIIGQSFDSDVIVETSNVFASSISWETNGDVTANYGKEYTAVIKLTAADGYSFSDLSTVLINGETAETSLNSDGTLSVHYTFPAITDITEVSIIGLDEPTGGKSLDTDIGIETSKVSVSNVSWSPDDVIANNVTVYTVSFTLTAEDECTFSDTTKVTINGQLSETNLTSDNTMSVSFEFPPTQQKDISLQSIKQPDDITVPNGTELNNINLPNQVYIITDDVNINKADVSWIYEPTDNTSYQPELKTEQTFILKGHVTLPDNVYSNNIPLIVKINITVSAAQVNKTFAPIAQPAQGEYEKNLKVTLSSDTPNATIYYTLDGSEPSALNGRIYNSPIDITGIAGNTVKTVLKAIAISPELDDSSIVTLTYYIKLPEISSGGSSSGGSSSSGSSSSSSGSNGNTSSDNKTETITNPDGSTVTTVTKPDGSKTETTKYQDGSKEVIETSKDGTITTTTTDNNGNKTEVIENTDGSSVTTITKKDGSGSKTTVDTNGKTTSQVTLTNESIKNANNTTVSLPIPSIYATSNQNSTHIVKVNLPSNNKIDVEIPVNNPSINTVAVLIKSDGKTEIIKNSLPTTNGIRVKLSDGDTIKVIDNQKTFYDVSSDFWGLDAIDFTASREILSGTGENIFSPNVSMNRAMLLTALARFDGVDTSTGSNWYDVGKNWAIDKGISDGLNITQTLTREQLVTMLYRYSGSPYVSGNASNFKDKNKINSWAVNATIWAEQNGLITGFEDGNFNPQGEATRAQVATILMRFIENF